MADATLEPGAVGVAATPTKPESPFRRIASDFAESKLATLGLAGLIVIILLAVFAPLITPQNPYDLTEIDLGDGRLPPGSPRLSDPVVEDFTVTVAPTGGGPVAAVPEGAVAAEPLVEQVTVTARRLSETDLALDIILEPEAVIASVESVRIDGLPRGATLSAGEKHSFRDYWTVPISALDDLRVHRDSGFDRPLDLELRLEGSARRVEMTYLLGTDGQGRDMFSAILYGLRISLTVGVMSGVAALLLGLSLGLTAAYFGGRTETLIMRLVDLQLSFPAILVALILMAIFSQVEGDNAVLRYLDQALPQYKVVAALIIVQWAYYARTARSAALVERRKEYIEAASCLALSTPRIIFRHLLPNCLPPVIVVGTVQVANAIALEATLSFLGIGLPITQPSLGLLIANGFDYLLSGRYWISVYPGLALLVTIVCINLVGDQLRDVLNPRLQR